MDDIKEIKADVKELLQRSAVHNELLRVHEARSLALQRSQEKMDVRLKPVEQHVNALNMIGRICAVLVSGGIVKFLLNFLFK